MTLSTLFLIYEQLRPELRLKRIDIQSDLYSPIGHLLIGCFHLEHMALINISNYDARVETGSRWAEFSAKIFVSE